MRWQFDLEPLESRLLLTATLLKDIHPDKEARFYEPGPIYDFNGLMLFAADDGVHGMELWRTDGTPSGTRMVKDIRSGPDGSSPTGFVSFRGIIYFEADGLWRTDGTDRGTALVKGSDAFEGGLGVLQIIGEHLVFADYWGKSLWKSDGTTSGTVEIIPPTGVSFASGPTDLTSIGNKFLFVVNDGINGSEFWSSDGTTGGTKLFLDLNPGQAGSSPHNLTVFKNELYFFASVPAGEVSVWKTDGSENGTKLLGLVPIDKDQSYDYRPFAILGDTVIFSAPDALSGTALWKVDGASAEAQLLKVFYPYSAHIDARIDAVGLAPKDFTVLDGIVYFTALDESQFRNLWRSDGTTQGTFRVFFADQNREHGLLNANRTLFFGGGSGGQFFKSDGTFSATKSLLDVVEYPKNIRTMSFAQGKVYFVADHPEFGNSEIWVWHDTAVLSGNVFWDGDLNGSKNGAERGVSGFRVFLDRDNDGICDTNEISARTSSTGRYRFDALTAGTYWIRLTPVEKWRNTTNLAFKVTVAPGGSITRHFGVTRNLLVSGTVYMDANVNGGKDELEPGLSGWRVFVDLDLDGVWDPDELSTLTDVNGRYSFSSLAGGTYAIRVVQPSGYKRTAPQSGIRWVIASPGQIVTKLNFGENRIA